MDVIIAIPLIKGKRCWQGGSSYRRSCAGAGIGSGDFVECNGITIHTTIVKRIAVQVGSVKPRDRVGGFLTADGAAVFRRMATGGRAHLGLADSWESVKPQVWARLTPDGRWPADGRHYVVTGHSKGGAEAEACALDLREAGVPWARIHVATFGAPRNKDAARARYYDRRLPGRTARVVHELDAVARVPWSPWPGSWRHVRGKLFITADGRLVREPGWWTTGRSDLRELRRALRELARGRAQELLIGDHLLGGYARDLPGGR